MYIFPHRKNCIWLIVHDNKGQGQGTQTAGRSVKGHSSVGQFGRKIKCENLSCYNLISMYLS